VLRPYRGELTMLDGRGEGGGSSDFGEPDYGAPTDEPAPSRQPVAGADIDDEIPF
jgi:single-strand DNA-binding protein